MYFRNLLIIALVFTLSACVTIPKVLQGDYSNITPAQSKQKHPMNVPIRWSGYIVNTVNKKDKTCFEVVQTQTYKNLRPKNEIPKNSSRFLACKEGFLEGHAFNKRMVTITGNLVAYTDQKIGEYDYEYPVVKTELIYIWRKQSPYARYNYLNSFATFSSFYCRRSFISGYCY